MSKTAPVVAIFREFIGRYPWQFGLLFALLIAEGAAAALSVLVPLADFLLDPAHNRAFAWIRFLEKS